MKKPVSPRRAAYLAHQREGRPVQLWREGLTFDGPRPITRPVPIHVPREDAT